MKITACTPQHSSEILAIFNDAILTSTALYDYQPRPLSAMETWFETKRKGDFPVIGIELEDGSLAGFASYGAFRPHAAYKYSVEHSVYVRKDLRGRGIGRKLLVELIEAAKQQNYHTLIGGIDSTNAASIGLHVSLGFKPCASIKQAGFKFGRWLDLEFYQLILPTPTDPRDG